MLVIIFQYSKEFTWTIFTRITTEYIEKYDKYW